MRRLTGPVAALLAVAVAACGGPSELSRADGEQLALARDRIDAALATEERMSRSRAAAERVLARVRKVVASGSLEAEQLDEFGLAALGELRLAVPSVVIVDAREIPRELDRAALRGFLDEAPDEPAAALRPGAAAAVDRIGAVLERADADPDSFVPVVGEPLEDYLGGLADDLRPTWPGLADRVEQAA